MVRRWLPVLLCFVTVYALPFPAEEIESDDSRRVLGSSVVTSVSVIMDLGNGTKKYFADAAGKPVPKPTAAALVGSPAQLLNPDRYEFYTFDESGNLVKRLMTLDEIQGIIANGEGEFPDELPLQAKPNYYHQKLPGSDEVESIIMSDKTDEQAMEMEELSPSVPGVQDVVLSVQNVLKEELSKNKLKPPKPVVAPLPPSTISSPDSSWMIIPAGPQPTVQSSQTPHTASASTTQPPKVTSATVEQSSVVTSNADTTKVQTQKPVAAVNESYSTTNNSKITTPQPDKPSTTSIESIPSASNVITTTVQPLKVTATSVQSTLATTDIRTTTVQPNATSAKKSTAASSIRITTVSPQKPNIASAESFQAISMDRTTTVQPEKLTTPTKSSPSASIHKTTNVQPHKSEATSTESFVAATNAKTTTVLLQNPSSTSTVASLVASNVKITTTRPQKPTITSPKPNTVASTIKITTVQPERSSATSIESSSIATNGRITTVKPQNTSTASTELPVAAINNRITNVQAQKPTAASSELSPAASNIKVTTAQTQKPNITSTKITPVASSVRTTTPQPQLINTTSSKIISVVNNERTTTVQPQKTSAIVGESPLAANFVKITTVLPKKPSVTPIITSEVKATTRPQKPSVTNTESFLPGSNIRITTTQPEKFNVVTEMSQDSSTVRTTSIEPQKSNTTPAEPSPASSNKRTTTENPESASDASNELSPAVSEVRNTTVLPQKPSVVSTPSPSADSIIKTTTLQQPQKPSISSTHPSTTKVNLKTTTGKPQMPSSTPVLIMNTQSLPISNKINTSTVQPQKLDTASTIASTLPAPLNMVAEVQTNMKPLKFSPNLSTAAHGQIANSTTIANNITSTTTPTPPGSANTSTSDKQIQENVTKLPIVLNGLGASTFNSQQPSSVVDSHTTDGNVAAAVVENQIDSLPTSDVIAQLSDNNEEVAAAQEFISLFKPSYSSSPVLNREHNKTESTFLKVSAATVDNLQQSSVTAASTIVTTTPQYYSSVTRTSLPSMKVPTAVPIAEHADSKVDSASTLIATASPTAASTKAPFESTSAPMIKSTTIKSTVSPQSYNITEDVNKLKIEVPITSEAAVTNASPVSFFSNTTSEQIPVKTQKPLQTEGEISSSNEDVMAELADSFSLVLSQVGGSVTTIDYGEELILMGNSSIKDSSQVQSSAITTIEAESTTTISSISEDMGTSQGNYVNIMNIKDMSTEANKKKNDTEGSVGNKLNINNKLYAESSTSEVKVEFPSYNHAILKLEPSKTKEKFGSEKNGPITTESKKPATVLYETTTLSVDLSEEQEEEMRLSTVSTDAQNDKESNKFLLTTTSDPDVYTETSTEVVDEGATDNQTTSSLNNIGDEHSNNYKKTDVESLEENSGSYMADLSENSTPTDMYQTTTLEFTTTDSIHSFDLQTLVPPTEPNFMKVHLMEHANNGSSLEVTNLKQSSKQNVTQETTTMKTTESNTFGIQPETTVSKMNVTEEQSTENTRFAASSSTTETHENATTDREHLPGITTWIKITPTERPQLQLLTREPQPSEDILKLTAIDKNKTDNKVQLQLAEQEKPEHLLLTKEPSEDILKVGTTDTHKADNKVQLQSTPQEKPEHRPLTKEPSEDILKVGTTDTHKADNKVQLQSTPQEKPEHRPVTKEPSEDILKVGTTDMHEVDNKVQLQSAPQEKPEHRPLTKEPSEDILKVGTTDTHKADNKVQLQSTPQEKPEHRPVTKEPSEDILKVGTTDVHKVDNKVQLQSAPQEKPEHRPLTKEPSEDILNVGTTDVHNTDNKVQLRPAPQEKPDQWPLIREPSPSEDILKLGAADADKLENKVQLQPAPQESLGLEVTSSNLAEDVRRFADLCNELAFRLWVSTSGKGLTASRSLILSPFAVTSLLAMVFLGARGPTSGQMNDVLRLDDMVTFNPHLVFRNITESITSSRNSGVATAAFVRELYSDRTRGKLLDFYKERAQQFYDGHVEEVNFASIGDLVRRRTNLLIKRQTQGRIAEYLHGNNIILRPPLAVFSANVLQTDCSEASTDGRDGEMYFTVTPAMRQRRLVPVPAAVWRSGFLAGYEPGLDATAVSLGNDESEVSVILVLPGQQGQLAPGDGLARLETRLIEASLRNHGAWSRLLRSLVARPGLELQLPRFSHRSLLNLTSALQRMGLRDLFSAERADLRGINGLANDLHLSDIVQVNMFSTCAEEGSIGSRHHVEVFPSSSQRSGRQEKRARKLDADDLSSLPLALRPRQARLPDSKPRLRFDRPFLYFVRHNPTGLIIHMGRFNPRIRH